MSKELVRYQVKTIDALPRPLEEELLISYRPFHNTEKWIGEQTFINGEPE